MMHPMGSLLILTSQLIITLLIHNKCSFSGHAEILENDLGWLLYTPYTKIMMNEAY